MLEVNSAQQHCSKGIANHTISLRADLTISVASAELQIVDSENPLIAANPTETVKIRVNVHPKVTNYHLFQSYMNEDNTIIITFRIFEFNFDVALRHLDIS
jgi:hypothetical protein